MSLRLKTILGVALIEALLLALLISTTLGYMGRSINEGLSKRASTTAALFASLSKDAVLSFDLASLEAFVADVMTNPDMQYARVIGADGRVFAQAGDAGLLARGFAADRDIADVRDGTFDIRAQIAEGGVVYGQVELGLGIHSLQQSLTKLKVWTAGIAGVEMVLVAVFSFVLGTYLTRQLKSLRQGAKDIAKGVVSGNYRNIQVPEKGSDELTEVARSFNQLVIKLSDEYAHRQRYQCELEAVNATLESRIEQRTRDLVDKNQALLQANTDLKSAQQQLVQAEKMASLGQLAAGVAHEINNPLGFVNANLSSLTEYFAVYETLANNLMAYLNASTDGVKRANLDAMTALIDNEDVPYIVEDTRSLLKDSEEGMKRVRDIVAGLKQFSRADTEERQLGDINACITATLGMVNNELKYHCEVHTDLRPLPKIPIHIGKINQVLTNLLVNAGQAVTNKGCIKVKTAQQDEQIRISVIDNGMGMQPDELKRIFDPFYTTKAQGTGLGLAISYGIVKEHGGELVVASEPGKGTCFQVRLPLTESTIAA